MTKKLCVLSVAVIALTVAASVVMAQGPGGPGGRGPGGPGGPGGRGPGGGMMMGATGILMNADARKELKITDDQEKQLTDAREKMRASFTPPAPPQPGQRPDPAQIAQMREQMQKMQTEMRANIEKILTKDQVEKLDVMVFQQNGGLSGRMVNNETLRALKLSDEQKKKIDAIDEKARTEMGAMGGPGRDPNMSAEDRQAMRDKMQKAREAVAAEVKAVLTPEQVEKATKLMDNVPDYLKARPGRGGQNGGGFGNYQPGQGGGAVNPSREAGRARGQDNGRRISGN